MLIVRNLSVSIDDVPIVRDINVECAPGTIHALMGPNGSGKSTLAHTIMGNPLNTITNGSIMWNGKDLADCSVDQRARAGIFLTFQQPPSLEGVQVFTFLHETYKAFTGSSIEFPEFFHNVETLMHELGIDTDLLQRSVNVGFSGGQKKLLELIQLLLLRPRLVICDELDSGLDVDALKIVGRGLSYLRDAQPETIVILITHYQRLLQYVRPDYVHVLSNGRCVKTGDATLAETIELVGYDAI